MQVKITCTTKPNQACRLRDNSVQDRPTVVHIEYIGKIYMFTLSCENFFFAFYFAEYGPWK